MLRVQRIGFSCVLARLLVTLIQERLPEATVGYCPRDRASLELA